MLNCDEVKNIISDYIDNEVDASTKQSVEEHISSCMDCRNYMNEVTNVITKCNQLAEEDLPGDFKQSLHNRLIKEAEVKKVSDSKLSTRRKYIGIFSSVAAGLVLIITLKSFYNNYYTKNNYKLSGEASTTQTSDTGKSNEKSSLNNNKSGNQKDTTLFSFSDAINSGLKAGNSILPGASAESGATPTPSASSKPDNNNNNASNTPQQNQGNVAEKSNLPQVESSNDIQADNGTLNESKASVNNIRSFAANFDASIPPITQTYNDPAKQKERVLDAEIEIYTNDTQGMTAKVQDLMQQYGGMFDSEDNAGNQGITNDNNKTVMTMLIPCNDGVQNFWNFWSGVKSLAGENNYKEGEAPTVVQKDQDSLQDARVMANMQLKNSQTEEEKNIALRTLKRLDLLESNTVVTITIKQW